MSERLTRVQRDVMTEASREIGIMPTHAKGVTLDALEARGLVRSYPSNGAMAHKYALTPAGWAAIGVTPPSDLARRGAVADATYGRSMRLHPEDRTEVPAPEQSAPSPGLAVLSEKLGRILDVATGQRPEVETPEQDPHAFALATGWTAQGGDLGSYTRGPWRVTLQDGRWNVYRDGRAETRSEQLPAALRYVDERESIERAREAESQTPEQPAQEPRTGRSMARGHRDTRRAARRVQRAARRANRKR